jgi:2-dehydro-3-deoxy-D-arabinonate dehydratase
MRLASLWVPQRGPVVCTVRDRALFPIGRGRTVPDVSDLILAARPSHPESLEAAVELLGEDPMPLAQWDDVEGVEPDESRPHLLPPVRPVEVWAAGVTYERSLTARKLESHEPDIYERVYTAVRPELFLKATGPRVIGPNGRMGLRSDSAWQVPEPECALVLGPAGVVYGYTLGNDLSSRDIEGENPLYLPQAKCFAGSCAIGPTVVSSSELGDPYQLDLAVRVVRGGRLAFEEKTSTARLHVRLETLIEHLRRDNWMAPGTLLLTGTGIVPPDGFTLVSGDLVEISSPAIGVLRNQCVIAGELRPPAGWD